MDWISSDKVKTYDWHPFKRVWPFGLFSLVCAGGCFSFLRMPEARIVSFVMGSLFTVAGISSFFRQKTLINFTRRAMVVEWFFMNRFFVRRKHYQLSDFDAVILDQRSGEERPNFFVGLNRKSGRKYFIFSKFWIKYDPHLTRAEDLADQLSQDLQLPIKTIR
jgi:hypothetical protein